MVNKTIFFTSKQLKNVDIDSCKKTILNRIKEEMYKEDPESKVKCALYLKDEIVFVSGEIIADPAIDASSVAINKINNVFEKYT